MKNYYLHKKKYKIYILDTSKNTITKITKDEKIEINTDFESIKQKSSKLLENKNYVRLTEVKSIEVELDNIKKELDDSENNISNYRYLTEKDIHKDILEKMQKYQKKLFYQ